MGTDGFLFVQDEKLRWLICTIYLLVCAIQDIRRRKIGIPLSACAGCAALLLDDGTVVTGSNQENAAYPSGLCAERTALFAAGHAHPGKAVTALAIAARNDKGFTAQPITPCGACRQVLAETEQRGRRPIRYILYGTEGTMLIEGGTDTILPFCFGADSMK